MTRHLLLRLSFDGTAYHGWQVQKNAVTVQQKLQDAIETVFGSRLAVTGCSRTDAGVHAKDYCCCFRTESAMPCVTVVRALNANLPRDIAVGSCREVPDDFHPRYSAVAKEYVYKICNGDVRDPFLGRYALYYPGKLNIPAMRLAAEVFMGEHDFAAFCASGSSVKNTVRRVIESDVEQQGRLVLFRIRADGFLYNMVRIMAGTLLYVSEGKLTTEDLRNIIASRRRSLAGPTAAPYGLYLNRVFYPGEG